MLVSHRYQFIYTKTVKTAGTSVESYFERFCMPEGEWKFAHLRDEYVSGTGVIGYRGSEQPENCVWSQHMPAARIKELLGDEIWSKYFKFCVVRNPYDRIASAYFFFVKANKNVEPGAISEDFDLEKERVAFENWLSGDRHKIDRNKYLIGKKFCLDDFIRFESLHADMGRICNRLELPWAPSLLPALMSGIRPPAAKTELLYTEKSRKVIEDRFGFELDLFGYSFPSEMKENACS